MAPTSMRFIAHSAKLRSGANSLIPRPYHSRSIFTALHPSNRLSSRSSPCIISQQGVLGGRRLLSTTIARYRIQPTHSTQYISANRTGSVFNSNVSSQLSVQQSHLPSTKRLASSQPPIQDDKKEPSSVLTKTATPTIKAPEILQKALSPTRHENIYTLPNFLTFSRLLAAPAIGYFILHSQPVAALALFAYAGFTDLIDGALARRYNSATVVGTILDPMADKTLMTVAVICLGIQGLIPVWLAVIILGRDVGLAISATYYRYISLPPPKTFTRYWDFSLPSAEVRPTEISKINTLLQLLLIGDVMVLPVLPSAWVEAWNLVGVLEGWQFLVAGTTIWSGLSYVFNNDAVKILSQEESGSKQGSSDGEKK